MHPLVLVVGLVSCTSTGAARLSSVWPPSGSLAGGTYVVLTGSSFDQPGGIHLFGRQSVRIGPVPCAIIEALSTAERIVCETGPAHDEIYEVALPVCITMPAGGDCAQSCPSCTFKYTEEETAFATWVSSRALGAGDAVAFGAAEAGALLGVEAVDKLLVTVGNATCAVDEQSWTDAAGQLDNGTFVNCVLPAEGLEPGPANLSFQVLPRGLGDPNCTTFPCVSEELPPRGHGHGVLKSRGSDTKALAAFVDPQTFHTYDLTVHPEVREVDLHASGTLGGGEIVISGSTFSQDVNKNLVNAGGVECHVQERLDFATGYGSPSSILLPACQAHPATACDDDFAA